MTKPLVSILVAAYNAEPWIAETLTSALNQTWQNVEIIVVDDGSTDRTVEIAQQFASAQLTVIRQANQGQSAAENQALQSAQGDFIQYLDADDLLAPDKIERQIDRLKRSDSGCVAACEWARFYQSPDQAQFVAQPLWADFKPVDWLVYAWENHWMMHGASWLIPRSIADRAGLWTEELSLINDFDYFSRVLLASTGIQFCRGAKTYYRSGNRGSLSDAKSDAAWHSAFRSLELGTQQLLATENSHRTRHACATVFQRFIYESYPQVPALQAKAAVYVQEFGGSDELPIGSPSFQLLSALIGWQQAKRLKHLLYRHGYQTVALGRRVGWQKS